MNYSPLAKVTKSISGHKPVSRSFFNECYEEGHNTTNCGRRYKSKRKTMRSRDVLLHLGLSCRLRCPTLHFRVASFKTYCYSLCDRHIAPFYTLGTSRRTFWWVKMLLVCAKGCSDSVGKSAKRFLAVWMTLSVRPTTCSSIDRTSLICLGAVLMAGRSVTLPTCHNAVWHPVCIWKW